MSSPSPLRLLALAAAPVAASVAVLSVGGVGRGTWWMQAISVALACTLALVGDTLLSRTRSLAPAAVVACATLAALALPLLRDGEGPRRWGALGGAQLYLAPMVLPAFLAVSAVARRRPDAWAAWMPLAMVFAAICLALQPDASQALAVGAGGAVMVLSSRPVSRMERLALATLALLAAWSVTRPDPLRPVPHVEGVFLLALGHSLLAGVAVVASAVAFVAGLAWSALGEGRWLAGVAAYYAVLFVGSVAGRTPAPLIGFGAGPLLGFGILVGITRWIARASLAASRPPSAQAPSAHA